MLRLLARILAKLTYGLRVQGLAHLPTTGPALIVCNHVSYADGALLMAASPRKLRFIIEEKFVNRGFLGWFLRRLGAVPIPRTGPQGLRAALKSAIELLEQGQLVVIFPEAYPTRSGGLLPFRRGLETLAAKANVPIIPACIDRMWGSRWGYQGGNTWWKRSGRGSGSVRVHFGAPLPSSATAFEARSAVQRLLANCAIERSATIRPVHRSFVRNAAKHPFRTCLIDTTGTGRTLSYGKALATALCFGKLLRPVLGVEHMVGIWAPSSTGGVIANLMLCLLGKTAVNLNYTAGNDTVRSSIRQCQLRHVLTARKFLAKVPAEFGDDISLIMLDDLVPKISLWMKLRYFIPIVVLPGWLLEWFLGIRAHNSSSLATVVFSSGSTGEPKGIMLSHGNIASNVDAFLEHAQFIHTDRVLGVLPFFHSFGYTVTMWGPLVVGASALYLPDPRAAKEVGEWARKATCTVMASTATFLRLYLRRCQTEDFQSMRLLVCGAEKLPMALADEFAAKFGVRPLEGYGCTELAPVVSANMPDETIAGLTQVRSKNGSVGQPLPGIACKTVDPESGDLKSQNEDGLLLVYGPNVMQGYLHRDDLTKSALRNGWYITGDIGNIDEAGFITLTGRQSRIAKIGGEMVPLERLEEELQAVLNSNDRVVAVTAVPDVKKGERIVVLHLDLPEGHTAKSLSDSLTARGLPNLWVPGERDFFKIDQMPILGSGKLDLQKLKQVAQSIV